MGLCCLPLKLASSLSDFLVGQGKGGAGAGARGRARASSTSGRRVGLVEARLAQRHVGGGFGLGSGFNV